VKQAARIVERVLHSLNSLMAKIVSDSQRDCSHHLGMCVIAYNVSRQEATSYSPFYLMHGQEAICPLDLLLDTPQEDAPPNINDYAEDLKTRLKLAFRLVADHMKTQVQRMKKNYDANVRRKAFRANDFVWHYYPRRTFAKMESLICWSVSDCGCSERCKLRSESDTAE
jgi:hypothetical protein